MAYDFDSIVNRRGTDSCKWDSSAESERLPMWVADMDFRAAPPIIDALEHRVRHGIFGYTKVPDAYYSALQGWFTRRYDFPIERDWIIYTTGVVPAISAILRALTTPGDSVIIQTPVYNCFYSSIRNLGCRTLENRLLNRAGHFEMDFEDLERKAADRSAKVMLLCHPHNPVGRCWTEPELRKLGEICFRHNLIVVSDEIHCDLLFPGYGHQPFSALGDAYLKRSITCSSPSKSFNIAGLTIANVIAADPELRAKIDKAINIHEVCDVNPFGVEALIAAYNKSEAWLESLRAYLYENYRTVSGFLSNHLPGLRLTTQEATYLAWIDCQSLGLTSNEIADILSSSVQLFVSSGTLYGDAGEGFIRLNMACPRSVLLEGLKRLEKALPQAAGQ